MTPKLVVASPNAIAVGERVVIVGQDFIEPQHGKQLIWFQGTYFDSENAPHPIDLQVYAKHHDTSKVSWSLFPDIVFHPNGDQLGNFVGEVRVINQAKTTGDEKISDPIPLQFDVKPSLIVRRAQPLDQGCGSVVTDTIAGSRYGFVVQAVGFREATIEAPLTFYWTFLRQQWDVSMDFGQIDPNSVMPEQGAFVLQDEISTGEISVVEDDSDHNFLFRVGADIFGGSKLRVLKTKELAEEANNETVTVNVAVKDATGKGANITIPLNVYQPVTLEYDGTTRVAQRYQPKLVSECIPGGDIGRMTSYREDEAETRSRSMTFQYNTNLAINLGLPSNPFALGGSASAGFGVDINATLSTTKSKSLDVSGQVLPGHFAGFYRQTTRVQRMGQLVGHTVCGDEVNLGEAILTDWLFTPELAQGEGCPPPSQLPKAQKFYD